jgi:hypothetical protein
VIRVEIRERRVADASKRSLEVGIRYGGVFLESGISDEARGLRGQTELREVLPGVGGSAQHLPENRVEEIDPLERRRRAPGVRDRKKNDDRRCGRREDAPAGEPIDSHEPDTEQREQHAEHRTLRARGGKEERAGEVRAHERDRPLGPAREEETEAERREEEDECRGLRVETVEERDVRHVREEEEKEQRGKDSCRRRQRPRREKEQPGGCTKGERVHGADRGQPEAPGRRNGQPDRQRCGREQRLARIAAQTLQPDPAGIEPILGNDPGEVRLFAELPGRKYSERLRDPREIPVVGEPDDRRHEELDCHQSRQEREDDRLETERARPNQLRRRLGWHVGQKNIRRPESGNSRTFDPQRRQTFLP